MVNTYSNNGKPYATEKEARERQAKVMAANADSELWLKMNGYGPGTKTKVEVVPEGGGFIVRETVVNQ